MLASLGLGSELKCEGSIAGLGDCCQWEGEQYCLGSPRLV